jgi:hypothetical protein
LRCDENNEYCEIINQVLEKEFNTLILWNSFHLRMGHRNVSALKEMKKKKLVVMNGLKTRLSILVLVYYRRDEIVPYKLVENPDVTIPFEVIAIDPFGISNPGSYNHKKCGVTIVGYRGSKFMFVEFMVKMSEELVDIVERIISLIKDWGFKVKRIQTDADTQFLSSKRFR